MRKKLFYSGTALVFVSLILLLVRSYTMDAFDNLKFRSFLPPAGNHLKENKETFSFVALSDNGARNEPINRILKIARRAKTSFVLGLGDFVRYRQPEHFKWIATELDEKLKKVPFYMIPGNHEVEAEDGIVDKSLYTFIFGQPYYWFGYGNTLFVGLDSSEEKINDEQIMWLKNVLNKVRPQYKNCIIYLHVPPINTKFPDYKTLDKISANKFANAIKDKNISLILSGHVHYFMKTEFEGVPLVTLPSSGQPIRSEVKKYGYVEVKVSPQGIDVQEHYIDSGDETEELDIFFSNAVVKDETKYVATALLVLGLSLVTLSKLWRKK